MAGNFAGELERLAEEAHSFGDSEVGSALEKAARIVRAAQRAVDARGMAETHDALFSLDMALSDAEEVQ